MDYNKENKGFICFMHRLTQTRIFYAIFALANLVLTILLNFKFKLENSEFQTLMIATSLLSVFLLIIAVQPKNFIIKLTGFLSSLGAVLVILHNLNKLELQAFLYVFFVIGFLLFLGLISWFIYNARSSEAI